MLDEKLVNNINLDFSKAGDGVFNASRRELSYTLAKEVTGRQRFLQHWHCFRTDAMLMYILKMLIKDWKS